MNLIIIWAVLLILFLVIRKKNNKKWLIEVILSDIRDNNEIISISKEKWFYSNLITDRELIVFKIWLYKNIFLAFANKRQDNKNDILHSFDKIYTIIINETKLLNNNFNLKDIENRLLFYDEKLNNMDYTNIWYIWKTWIVSEEDCIVEWFIEINIIINKLRYYQINFLKYLEENYSNIQM